MKPHLLIALTIALPAPLHAALYSLDAGSDTYIFNNRDDAGSRDSVNGSSSTMLSVNISGGSYNYFPLIYWDISSFSGQTVEGDATISLTISSMAGSGVRTASLVQLPEAFNESTTTFNNYNSGAPDTARIGTATVPGASLTFSPPLGEAVFTVPGSIVQDWIDSPATNFGVGILMPEQNLPGPDVGYYSRDVLNSSLRPTLDFTAVPEPSSAMLSTLAGLVLVTRRRR